MSEFPGSGLDLKDVVGSDNKLESFINNSVIDPDMLTIPKVGPKTVKELKRVKIYNTTQLMGQFAVFNCELVKCLEWFGSVVSFTHSKMIVTVVLYRMEMLGFMVPELPEGWRSLDRHGKMPKND